MTRVLLVGSGAGYSTKDLELGYYEAFNELGIDLSYYLLDRRLYVAKEWLLYNWKHLLDKDPARKPGWADVIYRGSVEALEMALRYDVDLVFVISAMYLHLDVITMMRRAGLKVVVLFTESPYMDNLQAKVAKLANICFTNERTSVPYLSQFCETHYIRHAYSPQRHFPFKAIEGKIKYQDEGKIQQLAEWVEATQQRDQIDVRDHDVVFVGTGFRERADLLAAVDWTGIDLGLYGSWGYLPSRHPLRKFVCGGFMTNMDAHRLYQRAKIGLNLYRTSKDYEWKPEFIDTAESMNPRAYELAAAGVFSLTQYRDEADETLGDSQPLFRTGEELQTLVRTFLKNGLAKEFVGEARQRVNGHIFKERAKQVLEYAIS